MRNDFPKGEIKKVQGHCLSLRGDDIDTDRIIPARFLKCVNFQSLGGQVFADDRFSLNGSHPFDLKENQKASILIVNDNFGCGSSREHAPQALMRWGIRAIIGQSFAEIFYGNCLALGIPCATAEKESIRKLQELIDNNNKIMWVLDLKELKMKCENEFIKIKIEEGPLEMFLTGHWDATSQLVSQEDLLIKTIKRLPYIYNFNERN